MAKIWHFNFINSSHKHCVWKLRCASKTKPKTNQTGIRFSAIGVGARMLPLTVCFSHYVIYYMIKRVSKHKKNQINKTKIIKLRFQEQINIIKETNSVFFSLLPFLPCIYFLTSPSFSLLIT